jgi:heme A synthase
MQLTPPKQITRWIALILGVVGVVLHLTSPPVLAVVPFGLGFWLVVAAFVLLLLATYLKGL